MQCRHCENKLNHTLIDLGFSPPSNNYLDNSQLSKPEITYPLVVKVCDSCFLVQTEDFNEAEELFSNNYAYFSSTSSSWLEHASDYTDMIVERLKLDNHSKVVEIASNDGYLLKNFVTKKIPCLGIEPTKSTADAARKLGIDVMEEFFGLRLSDKISDEFGKADLICGNNVYAHVPDINDFTAGLKNLLNKEGTITLEFPHLLNLLKFNQFDTIYHEHFSYLSLGAVANIFNKFDLKIYDVEEISTHGGSLRIYGSHSDSKHAQSKNVERIINAEAEYGLNTMKGYSNFQNVAFNIKLEFIKFLVDCKQQQKKVAAYGAAAKGNTLINYAGVKSDLISFVCDEAPSKQDKFLPMSHIPVLKPEQLELYKPDYVIIFPWNIKDEIIEKYVYIKNWGGQFVTFIPDLKIHS